MPEIEDQNFDSLVRDMKENDFTFLLGGGASLSSNVMSPGFLALNWFRILRKFMNDQDMPPADVLPPVEECPPDYPEYDPMDYPSTLDNDSLPIF